MHQAYFALGLHFFHTFVPAHTLSQRTLCLSACLALRMLGSARAGLSACLAQRMLCAVVARLCCTRLNIFLVFTFLCTQHHTTRHTWRYISFIIMYTAVHGKSLCDHYPPVEPWLVSAVCALRCLHLFCAMPTAEPCLTRCRPSHIWLLICSQMRSVGVANWAQFCDINPCT